jgi:DNA replication protein DnaC
LYGSNGSGKTFLSSLIVKEAYRLRYTSAIATLAHLMDLTFKSVKTQGDLSELVMYERADYLVIDEVGKENFTKTGSNVNLLEEILRRAVTNGQVVILCTNLPLEGDKGLYKQYGTSIKSLISGSFVKLEFDSDDYRPIQQKKKKALRLLAGEE